MEEKNGADLIVVYNSGLYRMKEAELLAEAGIDIIVSHVGLTAGGDVGGVKTAAPMDLAIEKPEAILSAAKRKKPDIIPLCHGGPIVNPEDVQRVLSETCAVGFAAASSIERLPIENGICNTLNELKRVRK